MQQHCWVNGTAATELGEGFMRSVKAHKLCDSAQEDAATALVMDSPSTRSACRLKIDDERDMDFYTSVAGSYLFSLLSSIVPFLQRLVST